MNKDFIALLGIFGLAVVYSANRKIGGVLIAVVVLGILLQIQNRKDF